MTDFNWIHYIILVGLSAIGTLAIMPYAFELNQDKLAEVPLSMPKLVLVSAVQGTILFAILTFIGLSAANTVGLAIITPLDVIPLAILLGSLSGAAIVISEHLIFRRHMPDALKKGENHIALWKRALASLYGGMSEEILTRLFLVSGLVWLFGQFWQTPDGIPEGTFILAILIAAIVFGLGHLPATAAMTPLTPRVIVRSLVLNGIGGIVFGWLFWQYGLVAAMVAHFCADIVLHVVAPQFDPVVAQGEQTTMVNSTSS